MDLHAKKQSDVCIAGVNNSVKPFGVQKASVTAPAVLSHDRHKPRKNDVSEKHCSVKKKKHTNKQSQSASAADDDDGETCHTITVDHRSLFAVMKPDVRSKSATKCIKNAKRSLKSGCSDSISNSVVSNNVCEALSQDNSVHGKRRKRKWHCAKIDSTVKRKKSQTVDSKSDEVHVVADKCSVGPVKHNFNVVQLRSALRHCGRLSDAVLQQDRLFDKNRTVQIDQETAAASRKREQVDTDVSEANNNSLLPSEMVTAGSSSDLLKERMVNKLTSARFRFVNEQLYNSTGTEAAGMFAHDKDAFTIYHAGFQSQVSKWPMNPVDKMINYINSR